MSKKQTKYINLKTWCLEHNPGLLKEWHPTKNGSLTPDQVTSCSGRKVWWLYPYDDPETGRHFDFEWPAVINSRTVGDNGCPFLSGQAVWAGYNDLVTKNPQIAAQWHPTKNGDLTPEQVTPFSRKKMWWLYPYDDPETGSHFDFEWSASIYHRVAGDNGCPFLSGKAVWTGYNDLATRNPEIAAQWHPTKNGDLTPEQVTMCSNKKVWWQYPYDDPESGRHFNFEWSAVINSRTVGDNGCPFLSGKAVWTGYNDLATRNPEIAAQWHPSKNGDLTPEQVTPYSNKKVWWQYPYDDPESGRHFDFEWPAKIADRIKSNVGCPFLCGKAVWAGYNDLATRNPEIAAQWHPTKNGDLTPEQVTPNSNKKVWWQYPYDDPESGRHFNFEWSAVINSRTVGDSRCPFLSGKAVWVGYNDLATRNPEISAQWHPSKNGDLTPEQVTPYSNKKVWWQYPYDDPESGRHFDFEWSAAISNRTINKGCPFLSGKAVWPGYNDLVSKYPDIAKEWHPTLNMPLTPQKVFCRSPRKVWWCCPKCKNAFFVSILSRTVDETGCKKCGHKA